MASVLEEKDFSWVCSALLSAPVSLPLVETVFLQKDEVLLWVSPTPSGSLIKHNCQEEAVLFVADAINMFRAKREKENPGSNAICVANVRGTRIIVDDSKAEEIISNYLILGRSGYLQAPLDRIEQSTQYILSLESRDDQFTTNFFVRRKTLQQARDSRLYYKLSVYCKMLVGALEAGKRKKVAALDVELTVDDRENIWITGCGVCKLLPLHVGRSANPSPKPAKAPSTPKPKREVKPLATVRLATPAQFHEEKDESASIEKPLPAIETVEKPPPLPISIASPVPRSMRTPPFRSAFVNPNFREVIVRAYAKSRNRLPLDIDQLYQDMEASLLKDEETSSRLRHSGSGMIQKKEDCAPPLFEIGRESAKRSEDFTRATTPLVFVPPTATTSALEIPGTTTARARIRRVRANVKSLGASSLQRIMDRYEMERRIEALQRKHVAAGRAQSLPRATSERVYVFKKIV